MYYEKTMSEFDWLYLQKYPSLEHLFHCYLSLGMVCSRAMKCAIQQSVWHFSALVYLHDPGKYYSFNQEYIIERGRVYPTLYATVQKRYGKLKLSACPNKL